ncbi:MAG TPA: PTS sugar transporter subunit IIB [Syntrophomonas sp.]|nr:PTS sugar transporter subunit IIB [Syntrophomonas sp.]
MQEIVNIRIDERLIHGQVGAIWTNTLSANRIMVIDDAVINDDLQKVVLKMACPAGVKLSILSIEKAAANLLAGKYENERVFIVLKGPEVLRKLWDLGFHMTEVTVGNMSNSAETEQLRRTVNVSKQDVEDFKELGKRGVKFFIQMVPNEEKVDLIALLK